jgi:putative SOS response-associated peptidase YedK
MCSRFENKESGISIFKRLNKNSSGNYVLEEFDDVKNQNIAPTDRIIVLLRKDHKFIITDAQWGIKFKNEKTSPLIFNSRIETIREKSFWKNLFANNRCLVPATAFYEWKTFNNKKIPHKISLENCDLFFFSSIYTVISNILSVSIITTEPNNFMKNIHRRMPHINSSDYINSFFYSQTDLLLNDIKPLSNEIPMRIDKL